MTTAFFVAADWLAEHIDDPEIQILDAGWHLQDRKIAMLARSIVRAIFLAQSFLILKRFQIIPHRYRI
ncbi:3-mercaptopyruvate sulfurtransferase [Citrobacter freundii]|nr:3-mercaptopyruvate sulfurtransferase [Citrobacter freundii]